jgi:hypothetical protein
MPIYTFIAHIQFRIKFNIFLIFVVSNIKVYTKFMHKNEIKNLG